MFLYQISDFLVLFHCLESFLRAFSFAKSFWFLFTLFLSFLVLFLVFFSDLNIINRLDRTLSVFHAFTWDLKTSCFHYIENILIVNIKTSKWRVRKNEKSISSFRRRLRLRNTLYIYGSLPIRYTHGRDDSKHKDSSFYYPLLSIRNDNLLTLSVKYIDINNS